eukprot:scaffold224252_cov15-Prasinocladus_malaysianus.AAC.1
MQGNNTYYCRNHENLRGLECWTDTSFGNNSMDRRRAPQAAGAAACQGWKIMDGNVGVMSRPK